MNLFLLAVVCHSVFVFVNQHDGIGDDEQKRNDDSREESRAHHKGENFLAYQGV